MPGVIQCLRSVSPAAAALALVLAQARAVDPGVLPVRPHIAAARTPQPPVVDGRLDDAVWAAATPSDAFVQHFPDEGAPPSERTSMRVLYDDKNLYVAVDAEQLNAPIVRRLARRDSQIPSDGVWIDIDSRRTGVGAFHFAVNAAGMLSDGIHYDDTAFSSDWDAVWEAKVAETDRGYAIEFRIPLSVLRFSAAPVQDWGFQVRRFIDARQETDDWAFYPRSAATYVPLFGRLDDLRDLAPRHALELRPFVLGRARAPRRRRRHRDADPRLVGGRVGRPRRPRARHQRADPGCGAQPRLRSGGGGRGRPEPVDVRDILSREAPVLPGGDRRLRDRPPARLHAAHRPAARLADADGRRDAGGAAGSDAAVRGGEGGRDDRRPHDRRPDVGPDRRERRRARHGGRAHAAAPGSVDGVQYRADQAQGRRKRRGRRARDGDQPPRVASGRRDDSVPTARRWMRMATGDAPTTPTSSAPTAAGARASGRTPSPGKRWRPRCRTAPSATSPTAGTSFRDPSRAAARSTSARMAARTGCGAPGSTSRARCWSSTTSAIWSARTTTRRT